MIFQLSWCFLTVSNWSALPNCIASYIYFSFSFSLFFCLHYFGFGLIFHRGLSIFDWLWGRSGEREDLDWFVSRFLKCSEAGGNTGLEVCCQQRPCCQWYGTSPWILFLSLVFMNENDGVNPNSKNLLSMLYLIWL